MGCHRVPLWLLAPLLLIGAALSAPVPTAHAAAFTVTTTNDGTDVNPGDGHCDADAGTTGDQCTLRAAILEANALGGTTIHTITVQAAVGTTYTLTQTGSGDDGGDLDIRARITINGAAPGKSIVLAGANTAAAIDRVFEVQSGGRLTLNGLTVGFGRARSGGAIAVQAGGQLFLYDVVVSGSQAYTTGGGGLEANGDATLTGVNISGNSAATDGGGLLVGPSATVSLTNVTVSGNHAVTGGGIATSGTLTLTNVTIAGNTATDRGGGLRDVASPSLRVRTTILADNSGGDCSGTSNADSQGYNLVKGNSCGFTQAGDRQDTDPLLGRLGDYGGPTPTRPIGHGSPAIDAGSGPLCATTDQRGVPRPIDGDGSGSSACDIGAFERLRFVVSVTADAVDGSVGDSICSRAGGGCTLRAAIQEASVFGGTTIALASNTYTLTIAGREEDDGVTGDLDVRHDITIVGTSTSGTIVDAGRLDRVFDIPLGAPFAAALKLVSLTVRNGDPGDDIGGGIAVRASAPLTLDRVVVANNRGRFGAGIITNSAAQIEKSTLSGNVATWDGGGLYSDDTANTTIRQSTISNNQARSGGGIFIRCASGCGSLTATNSTISGNSATVDGGGVYNQSEALFRNVTIAANTAGAGAGGLQVVVQATARQTTISNTIVAHNTPANCSFTGGSPTLNGPNLDSGSSCGFNRTGLDLSDTDPRLGALANNGGPTWTRMLLGGSRAIDAGNDAECALDGVDQSGNTRRRDGDGNGSAICDMGALEVQTPYWTVLRLSILAPLTAVVGTNATYTIGVNQSGGAAANTVATIDLPASAAFGSATPSQGSCSRSGTVVTCDLGTLYFLESPSIALTVTPTQAGQITVAASVAAASPENDLTDNRATVATSVVNAPTCSPRPTITVRTINNGDGRLKVTVTATNGPTAPNNGLVRLEFQTATNADVEIGGQAGRVGPFTYEVPNHPAQIEFHVRRRGPGASTQRFRVVDDCGNQPWQTFVGGGPTAF